MFKEAIAAWNALSAIGKATQLAEKHEWLLNTATTPRTRDVGCQTVDSLVGIGRRTSVDPVSVQHQMEEERRKQWLEHNGNSALDEALDISSVGLGKHLLYTSGVPCE